MILKRNKTTRKSHTKTFKTYLKMETTIIFEKDLVYGLRRIRDDNEFLKIRTSSLEDYNQDPFKEEECVYKGVLVKLKGNTIHPASLTKLHIEGINTHLQQQALIYDIPQIEEDAKLFLLPKTASELLRLYRHCLINTAYTSNIDPKNIALWLRFFCYYGGSFCACYDEYMSNPDDSVGVLQQDLVEYLKTYWLGVSRESKLSSYDIRATCHMIIISMNKSFAASDTERDRQMTAYMKNRLSAVYSSMSVPIGKLILPDLFFAKIGDIYRVLPKLRKMLFYYCFHNQRHFNEFNTACVLLSNSAMTTIKAMLDFISLPEKTEAHSEPVILEEIHNFLTIVRAKKDADGALWPYHRILHPFDGELNAAHFPNLAVSSIEYLKKYGPETFKFMVTPTVPTVPGIVRKATTYDHRDLYIKAAPSLSENAKKGAAELGLDVGKLMGTRNAQDRAAVGPEVLAFAEFLEAKRRQQE